MVSASFGEVSANGACSGSRSGISIFGKGSCSASDPTTGRVSNDGGGAGEGVVVGKSLTAAGFVSSCRGAGVSPMGYLLVSKSSSGGLRGQLNFL